VPLDPVDRETCDEYLMMVKELQDRLSMLRLKIKTTNRQGIRWSFTLPMLAPETIRTAGLVFHTPDSGGIAPGYKT